ncbi:MAG TPA: YidC/Oxa1 family membrane protein insertase [Acidimicrobiales bacterium]|nr:YidC/Oxa1 family membrane protein insertase [Acidimicrobiales bacterium]
MNALFELLAGLLAFFYDLIPNYAVAIVLLTFAVMLALAPITLRGTRSMLALQRLQPEVKKLQEEHKHDRQAANEALMAFYKEHKINPLSGCLPMIVQFPVLIVMFNVISGLTHVNKQGVPSPKYLDKGSSLYEALVASGGKMESFGVDLARRASEGGTQAIPLYLLVALVIVSGYWQVKQMQARSTSAQQMNPQAQMITKVMPLFSGIISFTLPGGVTLYFLASNLFRIAQQSLMYRFDPALAATVKREITEIETKTLERERAHREERRGRGPTNGRPAPAPRPSGRTTSSGRTSNGGRPGGSRSSSKKKSKRRKR